MSTIPRFAPGTIIVHRYDPGWVATVLNTTPQGVRVHQDMTDQWGIVCGSIECAFDPRDIKPVKPAKRANEQS